MTRQEGAQKRKAALLEKLGSEAALSAYYRGLQKKSMLNPSKQKGNFKGGFAKLKQTDLNRLKEISKKGGSSSVGYNRRSERTKNSQMDSKL